MYKEFYLMQKEPFDSHPSPGLFYKSLVHQTAWNYLIQGLKKHEPILLLAGDYGAGKTLLYLKLVKLLEKSGKIPFVSVPTPTYNFAMVLEKIIERLLNISPGEIDTSDESRLQQFIYEYFENRVAKKNEFIYVVIDDAQEFSYSFINKLRLFASYNCDGYFPIRIVLFAHHGFLKMLTYKKIIAFGQRIKRIYYLKPLDFEATREYIYFRLIHSGATGTPVFDDESIKMIQSGSKGNPRLINNLCDNCLLLAGSEKSNLVNPAIVYRAMEQGNLTGLQEVEKPGSEMQLSNGAFQDVPMESAPIHPGPVSHENQPRGERHYIPEQTHGNGGPSLQSYPAPQYPPPQYPLPGQEQHAYQNHPAHLDPNRNGWSNDVNHHGPDRSEHELRNGNKPAFKGGVGNIVSRYGKIGVIIFLVLVVLFLLNYLFGQYTANTMSGRNIKPIKDMPVHQYTIKREKSANQFGVIVPQPGRDLFVGTIETNSRPNTSKRYHPVLLTENFGS